MPKLVQRQQLKGIVEFELRDGSVVRIQPGPYGKGVAVVPVPQKVTRQKTPRPRGPTGAPRGRKPRPSTVALREKLAADKAAEKVREAPQYVKWLIDKDDEIGLPMARTVVYRELRKYR